MGDDVKREVDESNLVTLGQKRQNNENGGPASKRANMTEAAGDTVQIKVLIPSGAVGALIGKGGETMRALKNDSGCRVQMSKNQEVYHATNERICLVKGKVSAVMMVMTSILEKIQEKIDSNLPSDIYDLKGMDRSKEMKFVVPNTSAGMVIGKSGASIKEIREQTTANIQVYPKAGSEEAKQSSERVITIGHDNNEVLMNAVQRVLEKVVADPLHAHPTESTKAETSSSNFDFSSSNRIGTSGTQFGNMSNFNNTSNQPWSGSSNNLASESSFSSNKYGNVGGIGGNSNVGLVGGSSSLKFNPLQGVGNTELLTFLDNLQSTLRSSGFNESSVSEIMQAMQVLAKYNIMGLGLGLGVAAMAQMRTVESQAVAQQNALLAAAQAGGHGHIQHSEPQRYDNFSLGGSGISNEQQTIGGNAGGVLIDVLSQKNKPANILNGSNSLSNTTSANNFAATVITERLTENGHIELEVPDNIVGAVLGPRAKTLIEIQQLSGCKVEVHKRGNAPNVSEGCRLISLTGDNQQMISGRLLIERVINDEQSRRQNAGTRSHNFPQH
ncbi:KH domain-containing protein [Ditylenchus destructor]|nr:KH domain-containing protein [Ditylenchus destructor]